MQVRIEIRDGVIQKVELPAGVEVVVWDFDVGVWDPAAVEADDLPTVDGRPYIELYDNDAEVRVVTAQGWEVAPAADERSDVDPHNPVEVSQETWQELYARNPDLMDYDQQP